MPEPNSNPNLKTLKQPFEAVRTNQSVLTCEKCLHFASEMSSKYKHTRVHTFKATAAFVCSSASVTSSLLE